MIPNFLIMTYPGYFKTKNDWQRFVLQGSCSNLTLFAQLFSSSTSNFNRQQRNPSEQRSADCEVGKFNFIQVFPQINLLTNVKSKTYLQKQITSGAKMAVWTVFYWRFLVWIGYGCLWLVKNVDYSGLTVSRDDWICTVWILF